MRVCFMYQRIARSGLNRVSKRDSGWRWTFWYSLYSTSWCDGNNNKNLLCKIEIQWLSYSKVLELLNIRMSLLVCFLHKRSIPKFPIFLTMASKGWLARDMLPNRYFWKKFLSTVLSERKWHFNNAWENNCILKETCAVDRVFWI